LRQLFLIPFRLTTDARSFGGGYDVTGDLGWALPMILFPLGLLLGPRGGGKARFLWAYAAVHAVLWACARPVLRFLFPLFPLVCLAAGGGFGAALEGAPLLVRKLSAGLAAAFLLSNAVLFYWVERVRDPFLAAAGWWSREEYLSRKVTGYDAFAWARANLPEDARLLLVGDPRGYYCPRAYLAPMALLPSPLKDWADGVPDGAALRRKLLQSGFTHLLYNKREAERLKDYRVMDFTPSGRAAWEDFLSVSRPSYQDDVVSVYDLSH
jgi:hypothetical protein